MKMHFHILKIALAALLVMPASAQTPPAETILVTPDAIATANTTWQICNETSFALRLAIASMTDGKLTPRGWFPLRAGSCMDQKAPAGTPRFVYAESSPAHRGGIREWKGQALMCAGDADFVADLTIDCALQELSHRAYLTVDPEESVTTLVEIEDFGTKASTAGVQRLLQDNGYDITRIDGVAGRRTSRTLVKFLRDNDLPTSLTPEEQLDALEKAAAEKIDDVGLTVCNKSSSNVWTAVGLRRKGNWESKGWWKIMPENCGQIFSESLISADASYYAVQDSTIDETGAQGEDKVLRSIAAKPSQFCIADARFSVLGRENCVDQGYEAANFRALPIDKDGVKIELTDADFAQPNIAGLR